MKRRGGPKRKRPSPKKKKKCQMEEQSPATPHRNIPRFNRPTRHQNPKKRGRETLKAAYLKMIKKGRRTAPRRQSLPRESFIRKGSARIRRIRPHRTCCVYRFKGSPRLLEKISRELKRKKTGRRYNLAASSCKSNQSEETEKSFTGPWGGRFSKAPLGAPNYQSTGFGNPAASGERILRIGKNSSRRKSNTYSQANKA